ncbi:GNAT family N-acetyltransferase [Sulfurospirillum halorespirans]|uniref:Putative acetyltransferase n=1 Tax=Sulfurospirillum halorespirans DSM 13726 TaxID=1193502 RepID=A0A1D7TLI8_9BACT|nr:GNAT family N-acetyltransferase [Sulfurospirillum halorespirans]AOO65842.1 putative acetyltransferase [Sulfurospirillum halorespirans DSM 13726]
MLENLIVRIATRDDAKEIATFNVLFAKETVNKNVPLALTTEGVHQVFAKFHNGFYIIATIENVIIGLAMITREWSDWNNGAYYCIQSIFVTDHEHEKEIHDALLDKAKVLAKEHYDVCGIRLYVHKDDKATQKSYEELGLQKTKYRLFEETF